MANVLAWLTGREDRTEDPWPFQPQAELRAFNPPPSERFAHWVSGALGAGPGASLAHQRFAEGVPNVLSLFPPLGAGLSAADLLHAKAANDPMGVAAAALGMLPGARPAGKAVAKGAATTEDLIAQIATALEGKPLPGTAAPKGYALNPATGKYDVLDPKTGKVVDSLYAESHAQELAQRLGAGLPPGWKVMPTKATEQDFAAAINASGTHKIDPATGKTVANLPSNKGYTLSSAGNPDFPDAAKDYFIHDPSGKKIGELTHVERQETGDNSWQPAHWKLSMEGVAEKGGTSLDDLMQYIPGWHKQTVGTPAAAKQVLDYEKDDNGLYHIFDAISGKTKTIVDTELEAKQIIKGYEQLKKEQDAVFGTKVPITQSSTPSPKETKAPDLLEAQKRYEEAIAPLFQNLPERAVQQGYTTPAFRGLKIREGDVAAVHDFERASQQYSTANPMLADMYADYLNTHPGWHVPGKAFDKGASVAPLLLDTSKYHYYDAAGAHWSSSAGNQRGIAQAREKGAPGVIVDNVWDEPNSTHALGTPSKIFITFPSGASTVKSRFAELFDPTSPNMLKNFAGLAAGGTGLAVLLGSDRAQAAAPQKAQVVPPQPLSARINEIIDSLDWQDQWMGRMKLPLQRAAERRRKEQ